MGSLVLELGDGDRADTDGFPGSRTGLRRQGRGGWFPWLGVAAAKGSQPPRAPCCAAGDVTWRSSSAWWHVIARDGL